MFPWKNIQVLFSQICKLQHALLWKSKCHYFVENVNSQMNSVIYDTYASKLIMCIQFTVTVHREQINSLVNLFILIYWQFVKQNDRNNAYYIILWASNESFLLKRMEIAISLNYNYLTFFNLSATWQTGLHFMSILLNEYLLKWELNFQKLNNVKNFSTSSGVLKSSYNQCGK